MEYLFIGIVFAFGTFIGSFLNVLILRHGFIESKRSRSSCDACHSSLKWYELIPLVSYLFLRGRCRVCGSTISIQNPLIEVATGFLFVGVYVTTPVFLNVWSMGVLVSLFVFWSAFLALVVYDLKHTLVPFPFVFTLIGASFFISIFDSLLFSSFIPLYDGLVAGALFAAFMLFLVLITRGKGMGLGDVYVAFAIGLMFGVLRGVEVIALSFWIGAIVGVLLIVIQKVSPTLRLPGFTHDLKMKSEVPFIPFLFIGSAIGAFTTFSPLLWLGVAL